MAATLIDTKITTETFSLEGSLAPSQISPLLTGSSTPSNSVASMSTTWLKLNSTAPIHVQLEGTPVVAQDEPFSGAKKLRAILENTSELIVCPGVYDGLSARTAIELGFKSLYMVILRGNDGILTQKLTTPQHRLELERLLRDWVSLTLPSLNWPTVSLAQISSELHNSRLRD